MRKHRVVLVGLGFGAEFIPIYQQHPDAMLHGICRRDRAELKGIGDHFNIENRYDDYQGVLRDPLVDFVHINSPIGDHGWMSICLLYTSPSPRDAHESRMPSSA